MSAKIRVLHVIAAPQFGGAEKLLLAIAEHLDRHRFEVRVAAFVDARGSANAFWDEATRCGVALTAIPIAGPLDWRQMPALGAVFKNYRPDVVHSHGYKTNLLAGMFAAFYGVPQVIMVHGHLHASRLRTRFWERLNLLMMRRAARVIAVSAEIHDRLRQCGVAEQRLVVLQNVPCLSPAALPERGDCCRLLGIAEHAPRIGFVGRLEPVKGALLFIEAAARVAECYPQAQFLIAGDGSQRTALEQRARQLNCADNIIFLGFVHQPALVYRVLDLYVLSSLDEGIPLSLLEAMAAGVAVVATAVGGVPDVIENGVNGRLVAAADVDALAAAMCQALHHPDQSRRLAQQAQQTIRSRHNVDQWIAAIEQIYLAVLQHK